jgi:hypothetical protein
VTRLDGFVDVNRLTDDQLAKALLAGAQGSTWGEQAAIDLVVAHWRWLGRWEFRQAVDATTGHDGEACAWVEWDRIDPEAPASSGELRILAIARSLGGVASGRSLADLLTSLDETNTARVLRAVSMACGGPERHPRGAGDFGEGVS